MRDHSEPILKNCFTLKDPSPTQARSILSTTSSQKWLAIELVPTILYSHAIRSLCYMSEVLSTTTLGLRTRICITGLALPLMLGSIACVIVMHHFRGSSLNVGLALTG